MSLNIFLTAMFLWPLWISHPMSPRLRSIAKRTLYGASTSLISSMINIAILFLLGGNELGWICLSSCVTDVTINSLALFWLSSSSSLSGDVVQDRFSLPTMDMSALTFVRIDSTRPTAITSAQDTLQPQLGSSATIPEAFFDYIPSVQMTLRGDHENQTQEHQFKTSKPLSHERTCTIAYPDISGSNILPDSHCTPNFSATMPNLQPQTDSESGQHTARVEEEKDICDLK
ncbi:hypothetical protein GGU10DRAFT_152964 [Lentinula aff. detonsa]|uniref:Transmembrane protein n=1 Tax=Lentinula aff. detonsa TaxID=2804958 RepID=A0AA38L2N2_9AGAR|nr:hypothetical protein GGU10DRAFT_152964 [Lentinula aff. detonsa]